MPPARARCRLRYLPPTGFPWVACPLLISLSFQISSCAEGDDEFRTAALTGLHPSAATMSLGNLPHDGEPSARSFDLRPAGKGEICAPRAPAPLPGPRSRTAIPTT